MIVAPAPLPLKGHLRNPTMPGVKLLSNGKYHVMVTAEGSGTSHWNGLAVTRWREDASSTTAAASSTCATTKRRGLVGNGPPDRTAPSRAARFDAAAPSSAPRPRDRGDDHGRRRNGRTTSSCAGLASSTCRRASARRSATSFAEIVLAPAVTDASHPAFSKISSRPRSMPARRHRRDAPPERPRRRALVGSSTAPSCTAQARGLVRDRPAALHRPWPRQRHAGRLARRQAAFGHGRAGAGCRRRDPLPSRWPREASITIDWFTGIAAHAESAALAPPRAAHPAPATVSSSTPVPIARRCCAGSAPAQPTRRSGTSWPAPFSTPTAAMRGDPAEIAGTDAASRGCGVSGSRATCRCCCSQARSAGHLDLCANASRAHAFWRAHDIKTELMIVAAAAAGSAG